MTVEDLLEALLLESANDAAVALAENISGSREAFVEEMNDRAAELGLDHTSYANPIGLDEAGNYSTARDLATLARDAASRTRASRASWTCRWPRSSPASRPRVVANRNDLVAEYPWVSGVKTGYTLSAGNVLVGSAERGRGARVVSVVLGEPTEAARDADTLTLLRWGLRPLQPRPGAGARTVCSAARTSSTATRRRGSCRAAGVVAHGPRRAAAAPPRERPGRAGGADRRRRARRLRDRAGGRPAVRRVALVTAADVPGAGTLRVLVSDLGVPLTVLIAVGILVAAVLAILRFRIRIRIAR